MSSQREFTSVEDAQADDDWVKEHREEIEREAAADHEAAWVFQRLLGADTGPDDV